MTSTTTTKPDYNRSDEIDLRQLFGLLIDRLTLITLTTLFAASAGVFYAFSAIPVYQADSLVQVEEEKQGLDVAAMLGGELGAGGSTTKAEIEIIQSRMVLGEAASRTNADIVVAGNRMPVIGNFLTNLGSQSGPLGSDYGYSWSTDSINVTRFDVPEYALNLPHLIQFSDPERFSLTLDGTVVLEGRVGEQATDSQNAYRLFIQTKYGPHPVRLQSPGWIP